MEKQFFCYANRGDKIEFDHDKKDLPLKVQLKIKYFGVTTFFAIVFKFFEHVKIILLN